MKKRTKRILVVFVVLAILGAIGAWQREPILAAYQSYCRTAATTGLPYCDRVEIFHLSGDTDGDAADGFPVRPYKQYSRILHRKTLTGADAETLAALWRAQIFGHEYQAMCHEPAYAFRFYRGSALRFETSVCFHCSNFYVTSLGDSEWWGFDPSTSNAFALLSRLQQLFPESVPKGKE